MRAAVIINPVSGRGRTPPGDKAALARRTGETLGIDVSVELTQHAGHGRELARAFVEAGVDTVVAWGGDGTISEVAGAVAGTPASLGIVAAGSGDGFALTVGVASDPSEALRTAFTAPVRALDVGDANGRPFLNLAGIGYDARVARRFNRLTRRGGLPYLLIGMHEGLSYRGRAYRVHLDGDPADHRAFMMVFANGRQYGNNAVIAPGARFDDGLLDATIVDTRPFLTQVWRARRLFIGHAKALPGIVRRAIRHAVVESDEPIEMHLDGECVEEATRVEIRVRPGALRLRA